MQAHHTAPSPGDPAPEIRTLIGQARTLTKAALSTTDSEVPMRAELSRRYQSIVDTILTQLAAHGAPLTPASGTREWRDTADITRAVEQVEEISSQAMAILAFVDTAPELPTTSAPPDARRKPGNTLANASQKRVLRHF